MPETADKKITQKEFDSLASPMALDLIAVFAQMNEDIIKMVSKAQKDNWTPEELITAIDKLVEEPTDEGADMLDNALSEID